MLENLPHGMRNIRVLHTAALLSPSSGILSQMGFEQQAADELGLDWVVRMYCPGDTPGEAIVVQRDAHVKSNGRQSPVKKAYNWLRLRIAYHHWLLRQQDRYDAILIRYYVHDPFQLIFLWLARIPVYLVHHTLETPELALQKGAPGFIRSKLESFLGPLCISSAYGLIAVTQEVLNHQIERARYLSHTHIYPNGIQGRNRCLNDRRADEPPELLFVANFAPWHGLDLLLENIRTSDQEFILHLVGDIPKDIQESVNDSRVRQHGRLTSSEIETLSEQCWIGLASFALYRKQMTEACTLKVREYLSLGLPVYGDHQDIFPEDFPFFKNGATDIDSVLMFAQSLRKCKKTEVAQASERWISKKSLLQTLHNQIQYDISTQ